MVIGRPRNHHRRAEKCLCLTVQGLVSDSVASSLGRRTVCDRLPSGGEPWRCTSTHAHTHALPPPAITTQTPSALLPRLLLAWRPPFDRSWTFPHFDPSHRFDFVGHFVITHLHHTFSLLFHSFHLEPFSRYFFHRKGISCCRFIYIFVLFFSSALYLIIPLLILLFSFPPLGVALARAAVDD